MRTQALAKPEVGDFLSKNFVAVYDKVGTFKVNVGSDGITPNRNGGNVAAFYCNPSGYVIHAVAGPRTGEAFLAEARWTAAIYKETRKGIGRAAPAAQFVRMATALKQAHSAALEIMLNPNVTGPIVDCVRHTPSADPKLRGLEAAGRRQREQVHRLFKSRAFEPLATIGPEVYTKVLGEQVTTEAVQITGAPEARQAGGTSATLLEFYSRARSANSKPSQP